MSKRGAVAAELDFVHHGSKTPREYLSETMSGGIAEQGALEGSAIPVPEIRASVLSVLYRAL